METYQVQENPETKNVSSMVEQRTAMVNVNNTQQDHEDDTKEDLEEKVNTLS